MKTYLLAILLVLVTLVLPGYALRYVLDTVVCQGSGENYGILEWACAPDVKNKGRFILVLGVIFYFLLMTSGMIIFRLTHGMPFKDWFNWGTFLHWMKRIFRGVKADPDPMSDEGWRRTLRRAVTKTRSEIDVQHGAAARYTDEDFFDAILALPDDAFHLIASAIRPLTPFEIERGLKYFISADRRPHLGSALEKLIRMGLLDWWMGDARGAYLAFNPHLLTNRLALREDQIARLHRHAENKGLNI